MLKKVLFNFAVFVAISAALTNFDANGEALEPDLEVPPAEEDLEKIQRQPKDHRLAILLPYLALDIPPYLSLFCMGAAGAASVADFIVPHNGIDNGNRRVTDRELNHPLPTNDTRCAL